MTGHFVVTATGDVIKLEYNNASGYWEAAYDSPYELALDSTPLGYPKLEAKDEGDMLVLCNVEEESVIAIGTIVRWAVGRAAVRVTGDY